MTTILVAFDDKRGIGFQGKIPWKISEDLKLFKSRTMGNAVIMGRRTWESLPTKKLPGRTCIVLSHGFVDMPSGFDLKDTTICVTCDLYDALCLAKIHAPQKEVFIIGGQQVYATALSDNVIDRILVSKIPGEHEADTFFPELGPEWQETFVERHTAFDVVEFRR